MYYTVEDVEAMSVEEVRENLEKVMIADRDSSNYDESVVGANIVAGYEFDIR